jgi:hypothetical protein
MYYKCRKKYDVLLGLGVLSLILLLVISCDSILPEKFTEKEYDASATDDRACFWFADSFSLTITTTILHSLMDTNWVDSSENEIIFWNYDYLIDTLQTKTLRRDTLITINNPNDADQKVSYAVLGVAEGESRDVSLYTSLEYTESNINDYIKVEVVKRDTTLLNASTEMAGETTSCCTDTLLIAERIRIVPVIRARYQFHLDEDVYLVRFIVSRPEIVGTFKITVL